MVSKEEMKAKIHAAFDGAVADGTSYTKVYAAEIRQKNYLVFRTTSVSNFAVGFRPDRPTWFSSRSPKRTARSPRAPR